MRKVDKESGVELDCGLDRQFTCFRILCQEGGGWVLTVMFGMDDDNQSVFVTAKWTDLMNQLEKPLAAITLPCTVKITTDDDGLVTAFSYFDPDVDDCPWSVLGTGPVEPGGSSMFFQE